MHMPSSDAPRSPAGGSGSPPPAEAIVDISPEAAQFFEKIGTVSSAVGEIGRRDVSDGMLEISRRRTEDMRASFSTFKDHSLDLAITVCGEEAVGDGRLRAVARTTDLRKLMAGPVRRARPSPSPHRRLHTDSPILLRRPLCTLSPPSSASCSSP